LAVVKVRGLAAQRDDAIAVDALDADGQAGGGGGLHAREEEARELVADDQAGVGGEGGEQALAGAAVGSTYG
jgi:hypothetical protein